MTTQRKTRLVLLPVQIYGLVALLTEAAYRSAYGHEASSAFMMFAMWSCVAAGFLVMIGAVIQEHLRFRGDAGLNVVLGLFFIFAAANLAPFIAR
jgi:cytochrome b